MLKYKIDVLEALKNAGYSTFKIRQDKIFGEATLQKFREHKQISWNELDTLCKLLNCQPSDIIEYVTY